MSGFKLPESVLVVIYARDGAVLLLERADAPGFWQSVTGSRAAWDEPLLRTAWREVWEETGIDASEYLLSDWNCCQDYEIYPRWRERYAPGITRNREHVFGLRLPETRPVCLNPREHLNWRWLPWEQAAPLCFSPTNRAAILALTQCLEGGQPG